MAGIEPPSGIERLDPAGLAEAFARSASAAQDSFAAADGLTRMIEMPFGSLPGSIVVGMRTTDVLTHAWDLARATAQPSDLDAELAEEMLAAARERLQPDFRGPGRPFGPEQPCDALRPAADRLAAFLGRLVE